MTLPHKPASWDNPPSKTTTHVTGAAKWLKRKHKRNRRTARKKTHHTSSALCKLVGGKCPAQHTCLLDTCRPRDCRIHTTKLGTDKTPHAIPTNTTSTNRHQMVHGDSTTPSAHCLAAASKKG